MLRPASHKQRVRSVHTAGSGWAGSYWDTLLGYADTLLAYAEAACLGVRGAAHKVLVRSLDQTRPGVFLGWLVRTLIVAAASALERLLQRLAVVELVELGRVARAASSARTRCVARLS